MGKITAPSETTLLLPGGKPETQEKENEKISLSATLQFCKPFIVPKTQSLRLIGFFAMFCITGYKASLLLPGLAMKIAVDALSEGDSMSSISKAEWGLTLFFFGRVVGALFAQGQEISQEYCSQHMSREFAKTSFQHILSMSTSFHTRRKTGETISILNRGIQSIITLMKLVVFNLLPTIIEAIFVSAIFFKLGSALIAVTTMLTVVLYIAYTAFITKWRVKYGREQREAENNASSRATETIINYGTVKAFGMEQLEVDRYHDLLTVAQDKTVRAKSAITFFIFSQSLIVHFGTFLGLAIACLNTARGIISIGDFIMIQAYIGQLFGPLLWMGKSYGDVIGSLTNIEQVMHLFDEIPEVQDMPSAEDIKCDIDQAKKGEFGEIIFEDVSFAYDPYDPNSGAIKNVSFRVPAGKMVALVGPSGAGKSTIVKLLLRMYDVGSGRILVHGNDVRHVKQESLRKIIGLVAQETVLFNDTLFNNIKYGKPDATEAEVWSAVRSASLGKFVEKQTYGLDTVTGEQGMRLSGGERQRVGIARAILKQPGVMVLDESTSSLSTLDEKVIQENLREVCMGRTTLAIAHRLSTVMRADEILVFNDGQIIERGTHDQLVATNGFYATMWKLQVGYSLKHFEI